MSASGESDRWPYDPNQGIVGPRADVLQQLARAHTVLDVGCWSGYAGRLLLTAGVQAVDGVEPEPAMAQAAKSAGYRHVWATRIQELDQDLIDSYDAVVLYDVIEHLEDPWALLRDVRSWLHPGGLLALSVPNVCFWSVRKSLLLGRFEYERAGVLDHTHLRFFTEQSLERAVRQAGFEPTHRRATGAPLPLVGARNLGRCAARLWPALFAVQFVWLCRDAYPSSEAV